MKLCREDRNRREMTETAAITGENNWQEVHDLPVGTILVDGEGRAFQIERHDLWLDRTWGNPVSDEYSFVVSRGGHDSFTPDGDILIEVWRPEEKS